MYKPIWQIIENKGRIRNRHMRRVLAVWAQSPRKLNKSIFRISYPNDFVATRRVYGYGKISIIRNAVRRQEALWAMAARLGSIGTHAHKK